MRRLVPLCAAVLLTGALTGCGSSSSSGGRGDIASVKTDVETVAVALESYYRGDPYPQTLDEVQGTLDGAGLPSVRS